MVREAAADRAKRQREGADDFVVIRAIRPIPADGPSETVLFSYVSEEYACVIAQHEARKHRDSPDAFEVRRGHALLLLGKAGVYELLFQWREGEMTFSHVPWF